MIFNFSNRTKASGKVYIKCPSVTQLQETECGPACLSMLLGQNGLFLPLSRLTKECGVTRDGSKASTLISVADSYGLKLLPKRLLFERFKSKSTIPCIAFWSFSHWIVIEGYDENGIFINDPATGRRYEKDADFQRGYSQIALTAEATPDLKPGGDKWYIQKGFITMFKPIWQDIFRAIVFSCTEAIPNLVIAFATGLFVQNVLQNGWEYWFKPIVSIILLMSILLIVIKFYQYYIQRRIRLTVQRIALGSFLKSLLNQNVDFIDKRQPGEVCGRLRTLDSLILLLTGSFIQGCSAFLMLIFYLTFVFFINPLIGGLMLGILITYFTAIAFLSPELLDKSNRFAVNRGYAFGSTLFAIDSIATVKSMELQVGVLDQWLTSYFKQMSISQDISALSQGIDSISDLIDNILKLTLVAIGSIMVIKGHLQLSGLVAISMLIQTISPTVKNTVTYLRQIAVAYGDIARIYDVIPNQEAKSFLSDYDKPVKQLRIEPMLSSDSLAATPKSAKDTDFIVQISKDTTFKYDKYLDFKLSFPEAVTLTSGTNYQMVGEAGCGKTTFAKLLLSELSCISGSLDFMLVGGGRSEKISNDSVLCSYLNESSAFFPGPLSDSITYFSQINNVEYYTDLLTSLGLDKLTDNIPGKLSYVLNATGTNISARTLKMLEITRSLAINPNIIIFDYALDNLEEIFVNKVFDHIEATPHALSLVVTRNEKITSRLKPILLTN